METTWQDTQKQNRRKKKDKGKQCKQTDIRQELFGCDSKKCHNYEKEERDKRNGIAEYYKDQDRPPDGNNKTIQTSVADFFGFNPHD
eukprot:12042507-Ditylum_brightwellii.AAC.1